MGVGEYTLLVGLPRADLRRDAEPMLVSVGTMVAGQLQQAGRAYQRAERVLPSVATAVGEAHLSRFPNDILANCPEVEDSHGRTDALQTIGN